MAAGFIVVIARAFSTRDRLEKKQMTAIACFTVIAVVDSVIVSLYGVTGSVRTDLSDASVLSRHIVSLASLSVWLAGLRFVNWRFKLLVRLPETFAGDLLSSMGLPLFLVDRDNVITFANKEAASALGRGAAGAAKLEGTYFHDAFKNREAVLESAKKLHDRSSEHELWVGLVGPDTPVHVSMFPVIDDDDVYCGSFVMVQATGGLEEIRKRARLTNRELELLILLDQGFKTKEISRALFISELTAKTHIHNIYQKVGARSRVELSKMVRD
jgi:DNA-binding CsgD family transcriptional regulator